MVIPSMGGSNGLRAQAAVRMLVSDITYAQSDALAFQSGRAIVFHASQGKYSLVEVNGTNVDETGDLIYGQNFPAGRFGDVRITRVSLAGADGDTLIFDEMGGPVTSPGGSTPAGNGTIIMEGAGDQYTITIEGYTGRVTVTRTTLAGSEEGHGG